jgi:protein phosphatase
VLRKNGSAFFGVFDGHAGVDCANFMRDRFNSKLASMDFPLSQEDLIKLATSCDAEFLSERPMSNGGSTGTFFCAVPDVRAEGEVGGAAGEQVVRLKVGNVGDSRVLVFDGEKCVSMTKDHKPGDPEEKARIEKYGGYTAGNRVDGNLAVSRAFGDKDFKTNTSATAPEEQKVIAVPDVTEITLPWNTGCFAVVCCDGVFESYFSSEQVVEFVRNELKPGSDLVSIAGKVCHTAVDRGSRDNVTCMIIQFADGSDLPEEPEIEAVPGPWHNPQHNLFRELYEKSCLYCNTPIEVVLEKRFDELVTQVPWASLTKDQQYELLGFLKNGELPPMVGFNGCIKGPQRTAWFREYFDWAKTYKNEYGTQQPFEPAGLHEAQLALGLKAPPAPEPLPEAEAEAEAAADAPPAQKSA